MLLNDSSSIGSNKWKYISLSPNFKLLLLVFRIIIIKESVVGNDSHKGQDDPTTGIRPEPPQIYYKEVAVVSVGPQCASIGSDILKKGGNAIEAAIATSICDGVVRFDVMGIGGGFVMAIHREKEKKSYILNAKETAPAAATQDMFKGKKHPLGLGSITAAIPGQLKGYQEAFKKFGSGKVTWSQLFEPSIALCKNGFPVTQTFHESINSTVIQLDQNSRLREQLGSLKVNDILKLPELAKTLQTIADSKQQADEFYKGKLTKDFIADIKSDGGIITEKDLEEYSVLWQEPVTMKDKANRTFISSPLPSSGVFLHYIFKILDSEKLLSFQNIYDPENSRRIIEAFKYAFAQRTRFGDGGSKSDTDKLFDEDRLKKIRDNLNKTQSDPKFYGAEFDVKEDYGGASVVVTAHGDSVSVTSSINSKFGSKFVSKSTGILMNNEMDSFSVPDSGSNSPLPPSPANFIKPGKRALSSMAPLIVLDSNNKAVFIVGSSGGTRTLTSTAWVGLSKVWYDYEMRWTIEFPRFHHQLVPKDLFYEYGVIKSNVGILKKYGYTMVREDRASRVSVIILTKNGKYKAASDWDLDGNRAGY